MTHWMNSQRTKDNTKDNTRDERTAVRSVTTTITHHEPADWGGRDDLDAPRRGRRGRGGPAGARGRGGPRGRMQAGMGEGRGGPQGRGGRGGRGGREGGPFGPGGPGGFGPGGMDGWGDGSGAGPGGPRRGPGRGGRGRRGDVRASILILLTEQPRNGYQLMTEIAERSNGLWRPSAGSIYPALGLLEDEGLIAATEVDGKRAFRLSEAGEAHVAEHREGLSAPWERVAEPLRGYLDVRSEMRHLGMALHQVVTTGTPEQIEAAKSILEEAKRSLYRVLAGDATPASTDQDGPAAASGTTAGDTPEGVTD